MIKCKNSIGYGTFAIIILALVIAFVLFNYGSSVAKVIKKVSDVEICRLSVLAQAESEIAGQTPLSLKCQIEPPPSVAI